MYEVRHPNEEKLRNYNLVADKLGLPYEFEMYENGEGKSIRVKGRLTRDRHSYTQLMVKYQRSQPRIQAIFRTYMHEVYALIAEYEGANK